MREQKTDVIYQCTVVSSRATFVTSSIILVITVVVLFSSQWQVWEPRPIESILQVLQACMALAERRYDLSPGSLAQGGRCRVTFGSYHFNGDLCESQPLCREWHAAPQQWPVQTC